MPASQQLLDTRSLCLRVSDPGKDWLGLLEREKHVLVKTEQVHQGKMRLLGRVCVLLLTSGLRQQTSVSHQRSMSLVGQQGALLLTVKLG